MRRLLLCIALLAASVLASGPAAAAIDIYGKFTGIDGESTTQGHEKWIEVLSYSWGVSNPVSIGSPGAGGGKPNFQDFSFTKFVDKASPVLFFDLAGGKMIDEALFDVVRSGPDPFTFLKYKFSDVLLSSYSVGGSSGGDAPTESLSFVFGKIEMTFIPQLENGKPGTPITALWDVKLNKGDLIAGPVPEPSTWAMLLAGLAFVAFRGRKMVRARAA